MTKSLENSFISTGTLYEVRDNIAVIVLDSPPVNGLGQPLRAAIASDFQKAGQDDQVEAMVLASTGRIFCGGADISEFGSELAGADPSLPDLLNALEASEKIIVAAVNGMALGGGCELALACDYRIATPETSFGLPEVKLGLLPGAGGTQRLPRIANPEIALEMIVSGAPRKAARMQEAGVVDRLHTGEESLLEAAISYVKELLAQGAGVKTCTEMAVDTSKLPGGFFAEYRRVNARRLRGFFAPERCIQAVEAACELPLAEGLQKESALFLECMAHPEARAMQHLFFAERAAREIPGIDNRAPVRNIEKVAIIGSGTMGGGIAMNFANAGIPTIILDLNTEALEKGFGTIRKNYGISAKRGKFTAEQVEERLNLLSGTTNYDEIAEVDLVIEAVFENMDIKTKVFQQLDETCRQGAILASNTSTLDLNEIAGSTSRPEDVVGMHFFSPANVMRLLEIVRGTKTADDVLVTIIKLAKTIGKIPVVAGVCFGFIGNRMLEPYGREAMRLILEGSSPTQIDRVLNGFGMAMGFPSMADLAGNDVGYLTRQGNKEAFYSRDPAYAAIADKLYELGRYGQKTGRGMYIYEGRDKQEDPEVLALATELATEHSVEQREISDQEVLERTIYTLISEGAQVLEDGIAMRSGDIDIVYTNGYGFPAYRGGPMQYADEIGLDTVVAALEKYRRELGAYGEEWFKPAPLLVKLAAEGKTFSCLCPAL